MAGEWRAVSATAIGAAHVQAGMPNQDAVAVSETAAGLVAALADGHGGARHVRSATGAQLAVEIACSLGTEAMERDAFDLSALSSDIVAAWRAAVAADIAALDAPAREGIDIAGPEPIVAYGSTLLVCLASRRGIGLVQIGDGDIVVGRAGRPSEMPVPGDPLLIANRTTSLCQASAVDHFRHAFLGPDVLPEVVLMATDGYGNSFASADWQRSVVDDLQARLRDAEESAVRASLPDWLAESAAVSGDDATAVIVHRPAIPVPEALQ